MPRQRWLPLGGQEVLEALWEQFPPPSRQQAVKLYARLVTRWAGLSAAAARSKEVTDEPLAHGPAQQDSR
jgi:hypothetical protein